MTTLAKDTPRVMVVGSNGAIPVIAADIIYKGAAVGVVPASGHAQPLTATDKFAGFAVDKADNSAGAAAAINVEVARKGSASLTITGVAITDIGQPVYATDDNTFVFLPTAAVFIGYVRRYVAANTAEVEFDVDAFSDPYGDKVRETLAAATLTLDAQDCGKYIFCTVTTVITLPVTATALAGVTLVNMAAYGVAQISASPNANDLIMGPNIAGENNKDLINTLATAKRGDRVTLTAGHADGYVVSQLVGTWAQEG